MMQCPHPRHLGPPAARPQNARAIPPEAGLMLRTCRPLRQAGVTTMCNLGDKPSRGRELVCRRDAQFTER